MSGTALLLVLVGAACHALWNIVAKRSAGGGLPFVWLFGVVSVAVSAPCAVWAWQSQPQGLTPGVAGVALASAAVHLLYSLVLQHAYQVARFSVVYPTARGSGPLFCVAASLLLWSERPSLAGWAGVAAILAGLFVAARGAEAPSGGTDRLRGGVAWGLLTGLFIATYTLLDAWAVKALAVSPVVFYALGLALRTLLLTPLVLQQRQALAAQWRARRAAIVAVGVLSPLAYTLVLLALRSAPLSYVAPVREVSMLVGTLLGARLLRERLRPAQAFGAATMLAGVIAIALA